MTARANSLTKRDTARASGAPWSMPVSDAQAFINAFASLGYDVAALQASAGIRTVDLEDRDARIPCDALGNLFSCAQRQRFMPNLGLELARVTPLGAYPILDYLVLTSDTVGAGLRSLARYHRLVGNPVIVIAHEGDQSVRVTMDGDAATFSIELMAALMVLHFLTETDGRFAADQVCFQHAPDDLVAFERILGCPVHSNAAWNGIEVPIAVWRLPLRRRDPILREMLQAHADHLLARLPARPGLAHDVERALVARIAGGDTRIDAVAPQFGMSARTLQRRLADHGVSYQELLDGTRKQAAGRYVAESDLAICEIAYLLGYSEPAPFHRAFKRWYGMTPEALRSKPSPDRSA